ncbi:MAG: hypothetical protein HY897_15040 [Deltaproteobacteria bacterium]|nr:hypothetical protein [Deltaproteobacteria bacterium]
MNRRSETTTAFLFAAAAFAACGCAEDAAGQRGPSSDGGAFDAGFDGPVPSDTSYPSDTSNQTDRGPEDRGSTDEGYDSAEAPSDAATDAETSDGGESDAGGEDAGGDVGLPPLLTPEQIGFEEVSPPMAGSVIYFATWAQGAGDKDSVEMMRADKSETAVRFRANRVWSFGVARDGATIAFSSADPFQEQNFGTTIGDAIQFTWVLRPGEAPFQLTNGNVNDECHSFMPGDAALLICRRANFWQRTVGQDTEFGNDPYRIVTVDISSREAAYLTPLRPGFDDIGPALRDDGSILFWRQEFRNNKPYQSLMEMNGDGTGISYLLANSTAPVTSPDGAQVLFRSGGWRKLALAHSHDVAAGVEILDGGTRNIYDFDFSPDAWQVAFTMSRADGESCSDLYVAAIDGSNVTRIIDCAGEGKFVTGVKWVFND